MQGVYVRATSYEQLKRLGDRLSGVPSAAALELELSFGMRENLNLGTVRTFFRCAGLTERVRAIKYSCKSVLGTDLFPGSETPVSAELCPSYTSYQPAAFWRTLFHHSLVELRITVNDPEHVLLGLKSALRCADRICGTLRCLQVDRAYQGQPSLAMHVFTGFLAGLKLPCLVHLGSTIGVKQPFQGGWGWPQKEDMPLLQSFGGTREPDGVFSLARSGVHMSLVGALPLAGMAAMAGSALGPAIRELHITVSDIERTWEGLPAARPFHSVPGFLALLKSVQQLSIEGWEGNQVCVRAGAINALDGLQTLALRHVTLEGYLTGARLTQIVCSSLQTQLLTVLARPPPALASILVPHMLNAFVPRAVLGIDIPWGTNMLRAFPGAPLWKVSRETCRFRNWHNYSLIRGMVRAVPCRDSE